MKPWKVIASEGKWTLRSRGDEFLVQVEGRVLLSSRRTGSEAELARIGCARLTSDGPRVLVGGLGFGFTLRAVLDVLPIGARVLVCEPSPAVVEWNRGPVAPLAGAPLEDHRVEVVVGDVQRLLPKHRGRFDVILLDLDEAPFPVSAIANSNLYDLGGLSSLRASLKKGGRLAIWSGGPQAGFTKRLTEVGFTAGVEKTGDGKHLVFKGDA
jgi:spermidine synthase